MKHPQDFFRKITLLILGSTFIIRLVAQDNGAPLHYHAKGMYVWDTWFLQRGDTTHMFHLQTTFQTNGDGGLRFGVHSGDHTSGNQVVLGTSSRAEGDVKLMKADGTVLTSRNWKLLHGKEYHLRLVVVEKVIKVYVDNVLAIDFYLNDLSRGEMVLIGSGKAVFDKTVYHAGIRGIK